ncbi:hypothetical protein STAS_16091 [Striga asiatica]|uniref:Uncharacterized protein n=1 Tax=Striga asiatica TaxID=4170 RepID=A0A5A7Q3L2_STRAF|nr:hypothetical protein STAS_16091 [Striga asiatica]
MSVGGESSCSTVMTQIGKGLNLKKLEQMESLLVHMFIGSPTQSGDPVEKRQRWTLERLSPPLADSLLPGHKRRGCRIRPRRAPSSLNLECFPTGGGLSELRERRERSSCSWPEEEREIREEMGSSLFSDSLDGPN